MLKQEDGEEVHRLLEGLVDPVQLVAFTHEV